MINRHDPFLSLDEALAGGILVGNGPPPLPPRTKVLKEHPDGSRDVLDERGVIEVRRDLGKDHLGNPLVFTSLYGDPIVRRIGPPPDPASPGQWTQGGGGGGKAGSHTRGEMSKPQWNKLRYKDPGLPDDVARRHNGGAIEFHTTTYVVKDGSTRIKLEVVGGGRTGSKWSKKRRLSAKAVQSKNKKGESAAKGDKKK